MVIKIEFKIKKITYKKRLELRLVTKQFVINVYNLLHTIKHLIAVKHCLHWLNPFMHNKISHLYRLNQSISNLRAVG